MSVITMDRRIATIVVVSGLVVVATIVFGLSNSMSQLTQAATFMTGH